MTAEKQEIRSLYRGTAPLLTFVRTVNGSVAGWTVRFAVRVHATDPDPLVVDKPATITDVGSASTPGVFTVQLTKADTLALTPTTYAWSLERTDPGAEDLLAIGTMTVKLDVRNAA